MTEREKARQAAEIARLPIGSRVRAHTVPGLGEGIVRAHITEDRFTDGRVIPYIGFVIVEVEFRDDFGPIPGQRFKSQELVVLKPRAS